MKYLVDVVFFLSFAVLIWKIRFVRPFGKLNDKYLEPDNCNAMRGFFALTPMIVHIGNCGNYSAPLNWWSINGNMVVEGFFFFAGFGLMKQYMAKGETYRKGFLIKRIPKVLVPYFFVTLLYWAGTFVFRGFLYSPMGVLNTILCGVPIVSYSWFIIHLILFYVFFWILMYIVKNHYKMMILGGILYFVLTSYLFYSIGFGMHWYETSLGLTIGITWAIYEEQIYKFMEKFYWPVFIGTLLLTTIIYNVNIPWIYRLFPKDFAIRNVLVFALMAISIVMGMMKFEIGNPISRFLGGISLEIYLLHGFAIMALKNEKYNMQNESLFTILVLVMTILMAFVMKKFMNIFWKIICKKNN